MSMYSTDPYYLRLVRILGQIVARDGRISNMTRDTTDGDTTIDTRASSILEGSASPEPAPVPLVVQSCEKVQ